MKKSLIFWRTVYIIYWIYVIWYLCTADVFTDMLMIGTVMFAPFSPLLYIILVGVLIYEILSTLYEI